MKKILTIALTTLFSVLMPTVAQGQEDSFVAGFGFSIASKNNDETSYGGADYNGGFRKYEVFGAYEKFIWKGLFVMPEVSFWYSDNYDDKLTKVYVDPSEDKRPDLKPGKDSAWQIGSTISAMGAWRQHFGQNFSLDFLTGPRLALNFTSRVKGFGYEYKDFYNTATFEWRFGIAANIFSHWRLSLNFDLKTGTHKNSSTNQMGLAWIPAGEKRHNSWNFSIGYRF